MVAERAHPKSANLDGCNDDTYRGYCDHGWLRRPESLYESVPESDWNYTSILANGRRNQIERPTWRALAADKRSVLCCQTHDCLPLSCRSASIRCLRGNQLFNDLSWPSVNKADRQNLHTSDQPLIYVIMVPV